jgi:hypothetical protein
MLTSLPGPEKLVEVVTCRAYTPAERREKRRRERGGETNWGSQGCPAACVKGNELWLVITWARQIFDITYYIAEHIVL